jgi:hypothetical protein
MTLAERDELAKLVREIGAHFSNGSVGPLFVDFANSTRATTFESFWDMPDTEVLATARELAECLNSPVLPIPVTPAAEDET